VKCSFLFHQRCGCLGTYYIVAYALCIVANQIPQHLYAYERPSFSSFVTTLRSKHYTSVLHSPIIVRYPLPHYTVSATINIRPGYAQQSRWTNPFTRLKAPPTGDITNESPTPCSKRLTSDATAHRQTSEDTTHIHWRKPPPPPTTSS